MNEWSDYADWTSIDTIKLSIDPLEALRIALIERSIGGNWFSKNYRPYISLRHRLNSPSSFFVMFDSFLAKNWTRFVNFSYNNGEFSGQEGSAPCWTDETLLAYIGDESFVPTPVKLEGSLEWIWQRYKILNAMKWVYFQDSYIHVNNISSRSIGSNGWSHEYYIPSNAITYGDSIYRFKLVALVFDICQLITENSLNRTVFPECDLYLKIIKFYEDELPLPDFPGLTENIYRKFEITGEVEPSIGNGGNPGIQAPDFYAPSDFLDNDANFTGRTAAKLSETYEIMRYDVEGGFEFRADEE